MHQILIVEDDPALSQGIRLALGQEGRQFVQAGTIGQAELELAERTFDLLILDLNLPDGNGLDLLSRLRDRSALPVLILTANDLEMDQVTGLELGADDYVTKPFSLAVLRARVNSLLRRSRPAPAALELPPFLFDFDAMVFARDGVPLELSKTEQRLLRLLVEHRGQTLSREVLLDRVWDGGEFVDENALSVAVNRLRAKLADAPIRTRVRPGLSVGGGLRDGLEADPLHGAGVRPACSLVCPSGCAPGVSWNAWTGCWTGAIDGSFLESSFDESVPSALEIQDVPVPQRLRRPPPGIWRRKRARSRL